MLKRLLVVSLLLLWSSLSLNLVCFKLLLLLHQFVLLLFHLLLHLSSSSNKCLKLDLLLVR